MNFKNHFSRQAADYARFRPQYPRDLFVFLASIAPTHSCAWDCGTGNGQAAGQLAAFFDRVIATDASDNQIRNAEPHDRVEYGVAAAEDSGLSARSIDLITVAQALHWFEIEAFYREAKRVLQARGVLAVWCYNLLEVAPEIDRVVNRFYYDIVGPYWAPERKIIEERYQTLPFPFDEIDSPAFAMTAHWSLSQLVGYLATWSATQAFINAEGTDPIDAITPDLSAVWGEPNQHRTVKWPLTLRVGVLPA